MKACKNDIFVVVIVSEASGALLYITKYTIPPGIDNCLKIVVTEMNDDCSQFLDRGPIYLEPNAATSPNSLLS